MTRVAWKPSAEWIDQANITRFMRKMGFLVDPQAPDRVAAVTRAFLRRTQDSPEWFWQEALEDIGMAWYRPYQRVLDVSRGPEWADWFIGGETNIVLNCVDRHAAGKQGRKIALIAETEDGQVRHFTYTQIAAEVARVANALRAAGVGRGDTVACYMPMVAEVVFAMLGTQKIGAVFVPIFSGYAPPAVRERLEDADAKVLFTADIALRRGKSLPLKDSLDGALKGLPALRRVIVLKRSVGTGLPSCRMQMGRDVLWHEAVTTCSTNCDTERMPAMAPALMIYTSGTTGKPKGTVHTHAGCLAQMGKELYYNFDLRSSDVFWWFSDIGWMMGPWEIIGCTMHGGAFMVFEGVPDYPRADRVWEMVERHRATHLGMSPTAIRMLMRAGNEWVDRHRMESLRVLGSTGEPWDPESYGWYFERVGHSRCPVINISGGTDIVGCFLAPLPILPLKETSLQSPGLGMDVDVFNEQGKSVVEEVGYLVCKKPAPSMTRGLWKNPEKYLETYWSKFSGVWNHGDWAKVDEDGQWFLFGRADDTLKIAGRRVGPGEIEAALMGHDAVSEAAVIGIPDDVVGTAIICFVVLKKRDAVGAELRRELSEAVVAALGKVDKPRAVLFVDDLPKTRSAKIVRRLIQRRYLGEKELGDLSSLANPEALEAIDRAC